MKHTSPAAWNTSAPRRSRAAASVSSQVTHTLPPQDQQLSRELAQRQSTSSYVFDALRRLVALLLVGLLIAWLAPRWITAPAEKLLSRPLPSLGIGLVGLVAAPITWLVALGLIIVVAMLFGTVEPGRPDGPDPAGRSPRPGPGCRRRPVHPGLPVPGDRRLPGWALDPQPHPPGVEQPDLRTAADWPAHPGPARRRAGCRWHTPVPGHPGWPGRHRPGGLPGPPGAPGARAQVPAAVQA